MMVIIVFVNFRFPTVKGKYYLKSNQNVNNQINNECLPIFWRDFYVFNLKINFKKAEGIKEKGEKEKRVISRQNQEKVQVKKLV